MDCYNVQHDGGIGQKTVENTVSDVRREEVVKLGDSWVEIQQYFTKGFRHDINSRKKLFHESKEVSFSGAMDQLDLWPKFCLMSCQSDDP